MPINSEYHRRQAITLVQLARKTSSTDTAKALLKLAAEYIDLAEEAARPLRVVDAPNVDAR
jgi:hypothetical protein